MSSVSPENVKITNLIYLLQNYFVDLGKSRKFPLASQKVVRHFKSQPRFRAIMVR